MAKEQFSNRWGIILASLAMAIGAGNLWRFPRLAGQYGGSFLMLWILFLLIWSIPLLLSEFSIGKKYHHGLIGSYARFAGRSFTWAGFFITICTLGIAFYYSVVTGWALRYLGFAFEHLLFTDLSAEISRDRDYLEKFWQQISHGDVITILLYIAAVFLGMVVLVKGIRRGLEVANKILIPTLFILLLVITAIALNMENGTRGLEYMFAIDVRHFKDPKIWIEALSQSAWSTGAGWGLMMTISSYTRSQEDVTLNTFIGAFGNNTASLMAGMAILPSVFALAKSEEAAISYLQQGNQALTFTVIPELFARVPGGNWLSLIFFTAFFLAAFSSLLPMLELFISNLCEMGFDRHSAALRAGLFCVIFGFPSAYSLEIFSNQDWVWGLGLILTGLFVVGAVLKHGAKRFKRSLIDSDSDFRVWDSYYVICMFINVPLALFLIYWWMSQGYSAYPWWNKEGIWNFLDVYSNATIVTQWGLVLLVGIIFNRLIYERFTKDQLL